MLTDIQAQIRANEKQMYDRMKAEPKCFCGHARLRHGVFCVTSCGRCGCLKYEPQPSESNAAPKPSDDSPNKQNEPVSGGKNHV